MIDLIDKIRGKTGRSYSLGKVLYRDTILFVSLLAFFLVMIVFLGLYFDYQQNVKTFSGQYLNEVKKKLTITIDKTIQQTTLLNEKLTQRAEQKIVEHVEFAHTMAKGLHAANKGALTKRQIIERIKFILNDFRADAGAGYFFIYSTINGYAYLNSADRSMEGRTHLNYKNSSGEFVIKKLVEIANSEGSGFHTYNYKHPKRKLSNKKKIVFIKKVEGLDILIGTGYYQEDIDNMVQEDIMKYIFDLSHSFDNYIWIMDDKGKLLVHRYSTNFLGKSVLGIKDSQEHFFVRELLEKVNKFGEAYVSYRWNKPSLGEEVDKLTYAKLYHKWGWIFATGSYIDDVKSWTDHRKREFTRALIHQLVITVVVAVGLVFILSILIKRNFQKLNKGFEHFNRFFENPSKRISEGELDMIPYDEFRHLSQSSQVISEYHLMLKEEKERAEHALEARNEFINNMSHEIRTPMNVIIGMADILDESKMNQEQKKFLDSFQDACHNLLTLLNDILDLSKLESQKFVLEMGPYNLKDKIEKTIELHKLNATKKGLIIKMDFDENISSRVIGDQVRLGQVFSNLLANAVKFTQYGHIAVRAMLISEDEESQKILFSVYDTGIGIEEESIEKIFAKFIQADTSVTRKYGGTGLGLYITKMIVEAFGGNLMIASEPAKYTEISFEIEIKKNQTKESVLKKDLKLIDQRLRKSRILIVDDTEDNLLLMQKFLKHPDLVIETAKDGLEALDCHRKNRYDLILMDIQMPGIDGHEVTRRIRSLEKEMGIHTPIYALTAYAMAENINKSLAAGCDGHFSKPIRKKQIQSFIFSMLGDSN